MESSLIGRNASPASSAAVPAVLWCVGLLVVGIAVSGRLFRSRTS
jgi:hypothetical protein